MIVAVEVPVTGCVVAATPEAPYLGLTVDLDRRRIADLLLGLPPAPSRAPSAATAAAIATGVLDARLIAALARLVELLDEPQAAPVLAPLIERELHYRLLSGEHGRLCARWLQPFAVQPRIPPPVRRRTRHGRRAPATRRRRARGLVTGPGLQTSARSPYQ